MLECLAALFKVPVATLISVQLALLNAGSTQKEAQDLLVLAGIESGYNPRAVSSAGATGIFQLMPETYINLSKDMTCWPLCSDAAVVSVFWKNTGKRFSMDVEKIVYYNSGFRGTDSLKDRLTVNAESALHFTRFSYVKEKCTSL